VRRVDASKPYLHTPLCYEKSRVSDAAWVENAKLRETFFLENLIN